MTRVGLPAGTVTFLFTDVEGSTRLLHGLGEEAYALALSRHRRVVREACAAHGGVEVDTQGDAFFFAFPTAPGALAAAHALTDGLAGGPVRVRTGIHTGTPLATDEGYVGTDVHRAARIAAAAHGGQVIVSASTRALAGEGFVLVDLGEHRFKDLSAPERVFQLGEGAFPPLKSLYRTNLPVPATPFLGRETEVATVAAMLGEPGVRLVSLVGPGGTGKTRLALQAAAEVSGAYPDGVFWAPLAPLRDSSRLLPTVAAALGVSEGKDSSPVEDLARALAGRRLLVFVDNLEHLLPDAAEALDAFVAACPTVTTVVTTRERLQLPGERVYAVPPMNKGDGEALFRTRAAAVGVELQASEELWKLCARLDNLPLALELAAARTVVFSPTQLIDRLAQRLDLLKAGRGVDARQETLRATIAWSHELLDQDEQRLFRRLSVFVGGCSYDSAEQVAGADPDTLQSLVDKSLLLRGDSGHAPRFSTLETIREYAAEQLSASGESDELSRRHLEHYLTLAEECFDDTFNGRDDVERLEVERENLRLALEVALDTDPALAVELAPKLLPLWDRRGEFKEGREVLATALARAPDTPTASRAWGLYAAASLAESEGALGTADSLAHQALALFQGLGNQRGIGITLNTLAFLALLRGDYNEARRRCEESAEVLSGPGNEQVRSVPLDSLALVVWAQGDFNGAVTLHRETVARRRAVGSPQELAGALNNLGIAQEAAGEIDEARQSLEESVAILRQLSHKGQGMAAALHSLAHLTRKTAPAFALAQYAESLRLFREMEYPRGIAYCLEGFASIFASRGSHVHAAGLLGAASSIRIRTSTTLTPDEQVEVDDAQAQCRNALTPDAFARAWDEGEALDVNAAADWALQIWARSE